VLVLGYALAILPYLAICAWWRKLGDGREVLFRILAVAFAIRLMLLLIPPLLSEDLWRYVWDGMHLWAGLSPYGAAPSAVSETVFSTHYGLELIRQEIGHPEISTIYPPMAQLSFGLATSFGPSQLLMRLMMISADLVTIGAIWSWAMATDRPPQVAALFAFAPLSVMESAVGGHIDSLGVAALTVAGALYARGSTVRAAAAAAWAIGIKLVPILLLTYWARHRWRVSILSLGLTLGVGLIFFCIYPVDLTGLSTFAHRWRANDGLFAVVYYGFECVWPNDGKLVELSSQAVYLSRLLVGGEVADGGVWPDELAFASTKLVLGVLFILSLAGAVFKARSVEMFWLWVMGTLLLVSPVVHPWYLLWILPSAVLFLVKDRAGWGWIFILWSQLVWLAYLPRQEYVLSGIWTESHWTRWVQYGPVYLALLFCAYRSLSRGPLTESRAQEELDVPMAPEDGRTLDSHNDST
jgi:hypothetical protein